MSKFHASIRDFMEDVHQYLFVSLQHEVLSSAALAYKEKLLVCIKKIQYEYPELHLQLSNNEKRFSTCTSTSSPPPYIDMNGCTQSKQLFFSSNEVKGDYDLQPNDKSDSLDCPSITESEEYISVDAKCLPDVSASDLYSCTKSGYLDKRKRETIKGWLNPFQKRWCAMKRGVLYYYEKKTDRKQRGHIILAGYEARILPYDNKDSKKYNFCFELVCPGKRTYQFSAASEADMHQWISGIENYSRIPNLSRPNSFSSAVIPKTTEVEYDDGEEDDIYETVEDLGLTYSDYGPTTSTQSHTLELQSVTRSESAIDQELLSDENFNHKDWYVGLWDCLGLDDTELSFKRGDMIRIISKEYDIFAWWIGQFQGKVGFVPKSYLMEAYEEC